VFAADDQVVGITVGTRGDVDDPHNLRLVRDTRALPAPPAPTRCSSAVTAARR